MFLYYIVQCNIIEIYCIRRNYPINGVNMFRALHITSAKVCPLLVPKTSWTLTGKVPISADTCKHKVELSVNSMDLDRLWRNSYA